MKIFSLFNPESPSASGYVVAVAEAPLIYLAKFSGVGYGNNSGVKIVAFFIFPLIFIFPWTKAFYGFNLPKQTYSKSSSPITKEASASLVSPGTTLP